MIQTAAIVVLSLAVGALLLALLRRRAQSAPVTAIHTTSIADRIRAVGKLVGLEVHAKEIATSTRGWSWLPPILLSQAKIAMIFHFEKQYYIDLSRVRQSDLAPAGERDGRPRYRLRLPPVEGALRLTDVQPYDIQAGRILGLIDVIQMNAATQSALMRAAQEQAQQLFHRSEDRYIESARRSIRHHLEALLHLFDIDIEPVWDNDTGSDAAAARLELSETMTDRLRAAAT